MLQNATSSMFCTAERKVELLLLTRSEDIWLKKFELGEKQERTGMKGRGKSGEKKRKTQERIEMQNCLIHCSSVEHS